MSTSFAAAGCWLFDVFAESFEFAWNVKPVGLPGFLDVNVDL